MYLPESKIISVLKSSTAKLGSGRFMCACITSTQPSCRSCALSETEVLQKK